MIKYVIVLAAALAAVTVLGLRAWDATMTDEEVVYYLEHYPDEPALQRLAADRGL
jgi:hypothetical protein